MNTEPYTPDYYDKLREGARRSARVVAPLVIELLNPRSVIDIGCGSGAWLAVFRELGVKDIRGVDGSYVDPDRLEIPRECFTAWDLREPFSCAKNFDLVMSLEVAEHLPAEFAETYVESLTRLGPCLLFSAAVPFQGGQNHVNEQWPDYWARLFRPHDFVPVDCLRRKIWNHPDVEWWYAQNILLYVRRDVLETHRALKQESLPGMPPALVHPKRYLEWIHWALERTANS